MVSFFLQLFYRRTSTRIDGFRILVWTSLHPCISYASSECACFGSAGVHVENVPQKIYLMPGNIDVAERSHR